MKRQHKIISTAILMFVLVMITALLPVSTQEVQAAKKAKTYKITYKLNGGKNNAKNVKKLKCRTANWGRHKERIIFLGFI